MQLDQLASRGGVSQAAAADNLDVAETGEVDGPAVPRFHASVSIRPAGRVNVSSRITAPLAFSITITGWSRLYGPNSYPPASTGP
jgi:hypothetical protein